MCKSSQICCNFGDFTTNLRLSAKSQHEMVINIYSGCDEIMIPQVQKKGNSIANLLVSISSDPIIGNSHLAQNFLQTIFSGNCHQTYINLEKLKQVQVGRYPRR